MRNKFLPVLALSLLTAFQSKAQVVLGITEKIADIDPAVNQGSYPQFFASYNSDILFNAITTGSGRELWKTNGTAAGTVQLKDINPGTGFSGASCFTLLNGNMYFVATDGTSPLLWKTDGTTAGTQQISTLSLTATLASYNSSLLFTADNGTDGYELWKSDGTSLGTEEVVDLNPGVDNSNPSGFSTLGTKILFAALADGVHYSPCITDGTASGTQSLASIDVYVSLPYVFTGKESGAFCEYNGEGYFAADDGTHGIELWKTDGTPTGTVMVKDIAAAGNGSVPNTFKVYNGKLYFSVNTGMPAVDGLWISSGTAATTVRLKSGIDMGDGSVVEFEEMNGNLYFIASGNVWVTDGTISGTHSVRNSPTDPHRLTAMNGKLYCFGTDNTTATFTLFQLDDRGNVVPASFPMSSSLTHAYAAGKCLYFGVSPKASATDVELYRFKDTTFSVGVNNIEAAAAGNIYPNPATNSFSVKNVTGKNTSVYIYSLTGQLLLTSAKTENIDIAQLPAGIYTVQVISDGAVTVGKLRKE
jgi:ELWxxDGT repeat protein